MARHKRNRPHRLVPRVSDMFTEIKMKRGRLYGILVDPAEVPAEVVDDRKAETVWGLECFGDGFAQEKPMCEIIVTAANHAIDPPQGTYPGGLLHGKTGRHFTWDHKPPHEERKHDKS